MRRADRAAAAALCLWMVACASHEIAAPASSPPAARTATAPRSIDLKEDHALVETGPPPGGRSAATPPQPPPATTRPDSAPQARPANIPLAGETSDPVDASLKAGDRALDRGDLTTAMVSYEAARAAGPKRAAPIVGLARARVAKENLALDYASGKGNPAVLAAIRELRRAVSLEPTFGPGQMELGRELLLAGDAAGAVASLRKGVELMPDEAEAHSVLGVGLLATGHRDESLAELARAATLDPGSAPRHGNLGTALFMNGRVGDAIKEYEAQVRLADDDPRAHSDLGTALLASDEVVRAVAELQRAIQLNPTRATFHSNLGYALQSEGKLTEAVGEYKEALRLDPKLSSAWINLATVLARDPKTRAEARGALEKARVVDPTDPRVKANLEELDAVERGSGTAR